MLNNREIIITPTTNAQGYYNNKRTEQVGHRAIDINRDFGYKKAKDKCMETSAARAINEIFKRNAIVLGLTFHGGTSVVGYEWGTFNHMVGRRSSTEAPDDIGEK